MAPARRRLVLAVAVLLGVAVLAAGALATVHALHGTPAASAPAAVPQDQPGPVLLVPGYGGSVAELNAARRGAAGPGQGRHRRTAARQRPGRPARPGPDARCGSDRGTRPHRRALGRRGRLLRRRGGGPATGCRTLGGRAQARRLVTLGSPHHGTDVAALGTPASPGACPTACQQLAPDSPLLAPLDAGASCRPARLVVSIWTTQDDVVLPPDSAGLAGALEPDGAERLPGRQVRPRPACPTDPLVQGDASASAGSGPRARAASRCGTAPTAAGSARDVLGREVGPGGAEQHDDVDRLQRDAPLDVAPQDRVAEQVDERQPVPGRQVRLQRAARRRW